MKRWAALLLLVAAVGVHAKSVTVGEMRDNCIAFEDIAQNHQSDTEKGLACFWYVQGFADATIVSLYEEELASKQKTVPIVCMPPETTFRQMAAVYVRYVSADPASWNQPARGYMGLALANGFPCPSAKPLT